MTAVQNQSKRSSPVEGEGKQTDGEDRGVVEGLRTRFFIWVIGRGWDHWHDIDAARSVSILRVEHLYVATVTPGRTPGVPEDEVLLGYPS